MYDVYICFLCLRPSSEERGTHMINVRQKAVARERTREARVGRASLGMIGMLPMATAATATVVPESKAGVNPSRHGRLINLLNPELDPLTQIQAMRLRTRLPGRPRRLGGQGPPNPVRQLALGQMMSPGIHGKMRHLGKEGKGHRKGRPKDQKGKGRAPHLK